MILRCYSIFDVKAKAFLPPFFLQAQAMAVRAFADCVNDKAHAFGRNPHDYSLFHVGVFDDESGVLTGADAIECVCNGPSVLKRDVDPRQMALVKESSR